MKKILTSIILATSLLNNTLSQSQKKEVYSLHAGGYYAIPRKDIRQDFGLLKGLEISFEKPIKDKSYISLSYHSGYKWGNENLPPNKLEPKINLNELSINYKHNIKTSSKITPFYNIGAGYGSFKIEKNKEKDRTIEKVNGETINIGIGTSINLNRKKNKKLYFELEKEFFISNSKTHNKYSNIKINAGIGFNRYSKNK